MDWFYKALLTAGTVLIVMAVARLGGRRLAGVVAALPTVTAPTLVWLADDEGLAFAVSAAVGSVAACGMLAAFALVYARAARHSGGAVALICALCGAVAVAYPAEAASADLGSALLLALGGSAIAFAAMPASQPEVVARTGSLRLIFLVASMSAAVTALAACVGPMMGGFATGVLSSLPLVSGPVAMAEHAAQGHRAAAHFLRGYVGGLFGKAAFGAGFALLAPRLGVFAALLLASGGAYLLSSFRWRELLRLVAPRAAWARVTR